MGNITPYQTTQNIVLNLLCFRVGLKWGKQSLQGLRKIHVSTKAYNGRSHTRKCLSESPNCRNKGVYQCDYAAGEGYRVGRLLSNVSTDLNNLSRQEARSSTFKQGAVEKQHNIVECDYLLQLLPVNRIRKFCFKPVVRRRTQYFHIL